MTSRRSVLSLAALAALAGGAFTVDRRAATREAAAEAAFPPLGQILTVDGLRVHAFVEGSGPDLILIHGASGNLRDWTFSLIPQLINRYRVIAFDRPGLGWSDPLPSGKDSPADQAAHLRRAAEQIGVQTPVVLGHSYGGSVALAWALDAPETRALVLVAAASMPWEGSIWFMHNVMGNRIGAHTVVPLISAFAGMGTVEASINGIFAPEPAPAGYMDYIGAPLTMRRASLHNNSAQVAELKPHIIAQSARYPVLTLPIELVHGDADTIVPLKVHSIPLSNLLPNAVLTVLNGKGHGIHQTQQAEVIAAIGRAAARGGLQ
jgi:pimeloyl-ACP methyl ester carboxylesterase